MSHITRKPALECAVNNSSDQSEYLCSLLSLHCQHKASLDARASVDETLMASMILNRDIYYLTTTTTKNSAVFYLPTLSRFIQTV